MNLRPLLLLTLLLSLRLPAMAGETVAPVASYEVTSSLRTLRGCPRKHVVTSSEDWERVTRNSALDSVPVPDFSRHHVVLVVTEVGGGIESWVSELEESEDTLRVVLVRKEPPRLRAGADMELRCFFFVVPSFSGGIRLEHRTLLGQGGGFVQRPAAASPRDRDPQRLPYLGPDMVFSYELASGATAPEELALRHETLFPSRSDLPRRVTARSFPPGLLHLKFPRVHSGVQHVFGASGSGVRSKNPLLLSTLPASDKSGSPAPIEHRFVLEPLEQR